MTGRGQPGGSGSLPAGRAPSLGARLVERFESRSRVNLPVRVFVGRETGDAQILNISSRGLQLGTSLPLQPGSIVDVRRGVQSMVGEVRWVRGDLAGIRLRQRIVVPAFLHGETDFALVPRTACARAGTARAGLEGMTDWLFAHFQWVILVCAVIAAAAGLTGLLDRALAPLASLHLA